MSKFTSAVEPGRQLPLNFPIPAWARLQNLFGEGNALAVAAAHAWVDGQESFLLVEGESGFGKSHLLYAACHAAQVAGHRVAYLDLGQLCAMGPDLLLGYEENQRLALDNIDAVAGQRDWESGLFRLYNAARQSGQGILCAQSKGEACWVLPDWRSRLAAFQRVAVVPVGEADLRRLIAAWAADRGYPVSGRVIDFVLARGPRTPAALLRLLQQADERARAEKRSLGIPLLSELLG